MTSIIMSVNIWRWPVTGWRLAMSVWPKQLDSRQPPQSMSWSTRSNVIPWWRWWRFTCIDWTCILGPTALRGGAVSCKQNEGRRRVTCQHTYTSHQSFHPPPPKYLFTASSNVKCLVPSHMYYTFLEYNLYKPWLQGKDGPVSRMLQLSWVSMLYAAFACDETVRWDASLCVQEENSAVAYRTL